MLSVVLVVRNAGRALRYAMQEENFGPALFAAGSLVALGTITYAIGEGWNIIDAFYFAVSTLTTTGVADPSLVLDDRAMKVFTIFYQLIGIGILVEVMRRLGSAYVAVRGGAQRPPDAARPPGPSA